MSPWGKRERGGLYYTRSRKVGNRVVREYVGRGSAGELAARIDAERRQKYEDERAARKEERKRLQSLMEPVEELCEAAEVIAHAALLASGYHQHNRGEWRKKRGSAR